jgi:hypothetical protein
LSVLKIIKILLTLRRKIMKATKKIIGATCALVAAVALSAGTTFAWFSSNTDVSVSGLKASVKSDGTYLLISNDSTNKTQSAIQALVTSSNKQTSVTYTSDATSLLPVAHETISASDTITDYNIGWYYQYSKSTTTSNETGNVTDKVTLADTNGNAFKSNITFSDYVLKQTLYVTTAANTDPAANLYVSSITITNTSTTNQTDLPVKVLVTCGAKYVEFSSTTSNISYDTTANSNQLAAIVGNSSNSVAEVNVYIYYDGTNEKVTSANYNNIAGVQVSLTLSVTGVYVASSASNG